MPEVATAVSRADMASQTTPPSGGDDDGNDEERDDDDDEPQEQYAYEQHRNGLRLYMHSDGRYYRCRVGDSNQLAAAAQHKQAQRGHKAAKRRRQRSLSLDDILGASFVHESAATGERIIISRGWPMRVTNGAKQQQQQQLTTPRGKRNRAVSPRAGARRRARIINVAAGVGRMDEQQKRQLLLEFLRRSNGMQARGGGGGTANDDDAAAIGAAAAAVDDIGTDEPEIVARIAAFDVDRKPPKLSVSQVGGQDERQQQQPVLHHHGLAARAHFVRAPLVVRYELPVQQDGASPPDDTQLSTQ